MAEKIAAGKMNKFFKENTLVNQPFVKDNGVTIAQYLNNVEAGLVVTSFYRVALG
ncbi:Elongation factor Ts [compost metagenome]